MGVWGLSREIGGAGCLPRVWGRRKVESSEAERERRGCCQCFSFRGTVAANRNMHGRRGGWEDRYARQDKQNAFDLKKGGAGCIRVDIGGSKETVL